MKANLAEFYSLTNSNLADYALLYLCLALARARARALSLQTLSRR